MKENKIIFITMFLNLIVASLKIITGILFSFSTLIADSIQSIIDFLTDITSIIANKIGKRRANKAYPFGYGQVYYFANLLTGLLLFGIGVFIVCQFFFFHTEFKPNTTLLLILLLIVVLKFIVVKLLNYFGTKWKSELMIEAKKESRADLISTIVVTIILILSLLNIPINVDKIGCLGMAIYVFYISIKMIILNIRGILTNDEDNEEIKNDVVKDLEKYKNVVLKNIRIIKMATYYTVFLQIKTDDNLTIKKYLKLEKAIKKDLKNKNRKIRFIDIEPV